MVSSRTNVILVALATITVLLFDHVSAFAPPTSSIHHHHVVSTRPTTTTTTSLNVLDPSILMDSTSTMMNGAAAVTPVMDTIASTTSSNNVLAFADQGQNLAGIFFQASLLPYLLFLYFISFRANRVPTLGNFGFQFLLLFVLSTIPSGIITKSTYGCSLADVDWLHGGAEALLTVSNLLVVCIFVQVL